MAAVGIDKGVMAVTETIRHRSASTRRPLPRSYRARPRRRLAPPPSSCANLAHGFAACAPSDKPDARRRPGAERRHRHRLQRHAVGASAVRGLSAAASRTRRAQAGGTAQVAGGVPAMCDGVTQGRAGMELSLFSRDVIALSTAVALTHDMFDAALYLGICDKIVPGLLIGALSFGHLPGLFVPAGPMPCGLPNTEKSKVRERYARRAGRARRNCSTPRPAPIMRRAPAPSTARPTPTRCCSRSWACMLPGTAFINPGTPLRDALTEAMARRAVELTHASQCLSPDRRDRRRARHRQCHRRPSCHRRLDQPHDPPHRHRPRRRHRARSGTTSPRCRSAFRFSPASIRTAAPT